jgi:site-specific recombinase XerD
MAEKIINSNVLFFFLFVCQQESTPVNQFPKGGCIMGKTRARDLMMVTLSKATQLYLQTLETEGKSPRYIDWLKTRLRFFNDYIEKTYGAGFKVQDLSVEDGRDYLRSLMERDHPLPRPPDAHGKKGKLKTQYIHGLGRAVRSFSTWAYEEGYLEENVMRRLKLRSCPKRSRSL